MTKQFVFDSFSEAMAVLASGRLTVEELAKGYFFLSDDRSHVITPGANGEPVEAIVKRRPDLHELLVAVLLESEGDGRVVWNADNADKFISFFDERLGHPYFSEIEAFYSALINKQRSREPDDPNKYFGWWGRSETVE